MALLNVATRRHLLLLHFCEDAVLGYIAEHRTTTCGGLVVLVLSGIEGNRVVVVADHIQPHPQGKCDVHQALEGLEGVLTGQQWEVNKEMVAEANAEDGAHDSKEEEVDSSTDQSG